MSVANASAILGTPQPVAVGLPENPKPGSDGATTWNASAASPPNAVGFVSGSMSLWNSTIAPGHPWVMSNGTASSCGGWAWMKWTSSSSTVVVNWSNRLRAAARARQSYSSAQYAQTSWT